MMEKVITLKIEELKPEMKIGKTIIESDSGMILLRKNEKLTFEKIETLKYLLSIGKKIKAVEEESIVKIGGKEYSFPVKASKYIERVLLDKTTQINAVNTVKNLMESMRNGEKVDFRDAEFTVTNILDNILENSGAAVNLINIKMFDDYTYTHSVNVATISLLIASKLGIDKKNLTELGIGALFHDIGKIRVPHKILNKNEKLSEEEFKIMKKHPEYVNEILKEQKGFSETGKVIAMQHHEKFDGTGYPYGVAGKEINYFARIVAIADVYDALTTDRVYRKAMLPYEAIRMILSWSGTQFDPELVGRLLNIISLYPPGSYVQLNTGEIGVVKRSEYGNFLKPEILIIRDKSGKIFKTPKEVKLVEDSKRFILKQLREE